jgi:hypothetical protein
LKVKLDENLGNRAIELFREHGHEVATVDGQDLGGASDDELIEACLTEERVLGLVCIGSPLSDCVLDAQLHKVFL